VSSFLPTFKDTNKKANIYAIIKIRVSQRDRWIALGFELPIPGHSTRKKGHVDGSKPSGDLVPFSPRRVLPRFVNPRIGSKLLGFSI
jgi:hypothetical protein